MANENITTARPTEAAKQPPAASAATNTAQGNQAASQTQTIPLKKMDPFMMKRFVTHLAVASKKYETKTKAKEDLKAKLAEIRQLALNKRSKKEHVLNVFSDFEEKLLTIIKDEKALLDEQRKEVHEINTLKTQVSELNSKLIELGKSYAKELEQKNKKILEMKEQLTTLHIQKSEEETTTSIAVADAQNQRQKKIDTIESRIQLKMQEKTPLTTTISLQSTAAPAENKKELEKQLALLEKKHKELARSGKHSKDDLDRVRSIIESHKKKMEKIKK
jgi:hypothetical protein